MLSQSQMVGHALFAQGLVSSHSGNLSIRQGERLLITHRGRALGSIKEGDFAIALSFAEEEIIPCDMEGRSLLPKVVILGKGIMVKAGDISEEIAEAPRQYKAVLVKGHGSFAIGQLLEEACSYTTVLEQSCHLLYLFKALRVNPQA